MARHFLNDADVRPLVQDLVAVVLREGSVNSAQASLMATLAPDKSEGWLYPNRLHSLLSAQPSRAVNTETLDVLRLALSRLPEEVRDLDEALAASGQLRTDAQVAWEGASTEAIASLDAGARLQAASARLNLPPAVTQRLLQDDVALTPVPMSSGPHLADVATSSTTGPDWSFQDTAHARCVAALRERPGRKVGLVIPTGGGKTRVAIRIALSMLVASEQDDSIVLWVTHRTQLKAQARQELLRAITEGTPELPDHATRLLSDRMQFCMVGALPELLEEHKARTALVIVDEAHHAAAASYQPLFEYKPLSGLFLTATPNRTDLLPIGIDEIAYTITPRELFNRGAIVEPVFETLDLFDFDWDDGIQVADLADFLLSRAEEDFVKTLVAVTAIAHAQQLHQALEEAVQVGGENGILEVDDVGYVHGGGSSTGQTAEVFLEDFAGRARGIVVATAQLLGEGFDDPSINAVVVAYATNSMVQLMQVAGRALRYAPGKRSAHIVQVRESKLAYHYEQRWLYQDISDELHPRLDDRDYVSKDDLVAQAEKLLGTVNANKQNRAAVLATLDEVEAGEAVSILLSGLPFSGSVANFATDAGWHAVPVSNANRELFLRVFNEFSSREAEVNDPQDFLRNFVAPNTAPGSTWKLYIDMLHAMQYAHRELTNVPYVGAAARSYDPAVGTTWLRYVSFHYRPLLPEQLQAFLVDATNRDAVTADYLADPRSWTMAVKVQLPLAGSLVYLLSRAQAEWFTAERNRVRISLQAAEHQTFGLVADWRNSLQSVPIPLPIVERFESYLRAEGLASLSLSLVC
jgi:superfamily II DNA or RNA helicase